MKNTGNQLFLNGRPLPSLDYSEDDRLPPEADPIPTDPEEMQKYFTAIIKSNRENSGENQRILKELGKYSQLPKLDEPDDAPSHHKNSGIGRAKF